MVWFLSLPIITAIGFNQMRQMLAIAILFFASQYLVKLSFKNVSTYTALAICAGLSHRSATFIALAFLTVRLSIRDNGERANTAYIMVRVLIASIALLAVGMVGISLTGVTVPYLDEFSRLLFINGTVSGNLLGVADIRPENVILLCIFLPVVVMTRFNDTGAEYIQTRMLSVLCAVGLFLTLMSVFVMNGERLAQYFVIFPIIVYYVWISYSVMMRNIVYPMGMFLLIMLLGWQGVLPYHTIFEKNVDINAVNSLSVRPLYNQMLCGINYISCNDQIYFDKVNRERHEYREGDLWKLGH